MGIGWMFGFIWMSVLIYMLVNDANGKHLVAPGVLYVIHSEGTWVQRLLVCRRSANLYDHSQQSSCTSLVARMSTCIFEINEWMASNRLKLNPIKTEVIWLGSPQRLKHCPVGELQIAGVGIKPTTHVRDLGVMIDNDLSLQCHVNHITRTCFYHLRHLRVIRRLLTVDTAHSLVRALVHSRLDYCNGVLAGMHQYQYDRLQSVLRAAARLVLRLPKWASVSEAMRTKLHWLPYPERVEFKLCSTIYKCLHNSAPQSAVPDWTMHTGRHTPGTMPSAIGCIWRSLRTGNVY